MKNFKEKERFCQATFASNGPFWHCFTSGKETEIMFIDTEDFVFAMNVIAQATSKFGKTVKVIAFEIMDNHFHFVLMCEMAEAINYFEFIKRRLGRVFPIVRKLHLNCKAIDNLRSLRNCIVYVNRNGYVVSPDHTPFSYPWGSNRYYFNDVPICRFVGSMKNIDIRAMFRGRDPLLPKDWGLIDGHIAPLFYCSINLGMSMFRDAHHYFYLVSKSVESYSDVASDLNDGEFLTDQELFMELYKTLNEKYACAKLSELSKAQKMDLARTLRYQYHSSNGQITRILGISSYDISQLFK